MPLEATCSSCNKPYLYPALQKAAQTGRCPACQRDHDIKEMGHEISDYSYRINRILPELKKLQNTKIATQRAADEAYDAWEATARVHAALDRKLNIIMHERDLLVGAKQVAAQKSSKKTKTPEQKAKAALDKLPAAVRAALLKQFNQEEN